MKTQKTIFNVMALFCGLAVLVPAMAIGEGPSSGRFDGLLREILEGEMKIGNVPYGVNLSNGVSLGEFPAGVANVSNVLDVAFGRNKLFTVAKNVPENIQKYVSRFGSYIKSHGDLSVYNFLSSCGLKAYNTVICWKILKLQRQ